MFFFPKKFYEENKINFIFNTKINNFDFKNKKITSKDNKVFIYNKLLIATGSKNRYLKFDGEDLVPDENLIYLRNSKESEAIKNKIKLSHNIFNYRWRIYRFGDCLICFST